MKDILLACNDGMSTGYLVNKMNDYLKKNGIDCVARAVAEATLEREWEGASCVLLGPQVGYMKSAVEKRIGGKVPIDIINPVDYGRINAEAVVKQALALIGE